MDLNSLQLIKKLPPVTKANTGKNQKARTLQLEEEEGGPVISNHSYPSEKKG
ncbi:hypothetical protein OROMI_001494 [Orobanche minor]